AAAGGEQGVRLAASLGGVLEHFFRPVFLRAELHVHRGGLVGDALGLLEVALSQQSAGLLHLRAGPLHRRALRGRAGRQDARVAARRDQPPWKPRAVPEPSRSTSGPTGRPVRPPRPARVRGSSESGCPGRPAPSPRSRPVYPGPPSYVALPPWPPFPHRAPLLD